MRSTKCSNCFMKIAAALTLLAGAETARGGGVILFSDLGSGGNVYNTGSGYLVSGSTSGAGQAASEYFAFTPSASAFLAQIDVAILSITGTNSVQVTLNSDSAGSPGAALEGWTLINLQTVPNSCCGLETVLSTSPVFLAAGTQYWVGASAIASDTWAEFYLDSTSITGTRAFSINGGSFLLGPNTLGAFDVIGVPEPGTFALAATGLALCLLLRRHPLRA